MKVIRTTEGYMVELPSGQYLCDIHGDNLWDTRAEADEVMAIGCGQLAQSVQPVQPVQQDLPAIHVRVMDVYGRQVVYPVCDHAKVFASIADTKTLTETTLRCIRKLGYAIHVIPNEQPTLGV
jgi:hypothetical protein